MASSFEDLAGLPLERGNTVTPYKRSASGNTALFTRGNLDGATLKFQISPNGRGEWFDVTTIANLGYAVIAVPAMYTRFIIENPGAATRIHAYSSYISEA